MQLVNSHIEEFHTLADYQQQEPGHVDSLGYRFFSSLELSSLSELVHTVASDFLFLAESCRSTANKKICFSL